LSETIGAFLLLAIAGAIVLKMSLAPPLRPAKRRARLRARPRAAADRIAKRADQVPPAGSPARPAVPVRPAVTERDNALVRAPILTEEFEPVNSRGGGVLSSTRLVLGVTGLGIATAAGMILIARAIVLLLERLVRL
jgi:hypothetical protein